MSLFNEGTYQHEEGFKITINSDDEVMISLEHPVSIRISSVFDVSKWTDLDDTTEDDDTEMESV